MRVVEVPGYSLELCGGTHVGSSAEIGPFVAPLRELGRRRRASGRGASRRARPGPSSTSRLASSLSSEPRWTRLRKGAEVGACRRRPIAVPDPDIRAEGGVNVIVQPVDGLDADELLELSDRYKQRHAPAAVVLGSREDGKVHLVANFDESVAEKVSASDVLREAAAIVGGGGGGRPTMARAGGKDPEKLPEALAEAERLIVAVL